MNWYKNAQHSNMEVYVHPKSNPGNSYSNSYVDYINVPDDPYHKQKNSPQDAKRKYEYFLSEQSRVSKRTAVTAINRVAHAINDIVNARRKLSNTIDSDEYKALGRLIKSLVADTDEEIENKKILLESLFTIETICNSITEQTEVILPAKYNNISEYINMWLQKNDSNLLKNKVFPKNTD